MENRFCHVQYDPDLLLGSSAQTHCNLRTNNTSFLIYRKITLFWHAIVIIVNNERVSGVFRRILTTNSNDNKVPSWLAQGARGEQNGGESREQSIIDIYRNCQDCCYFQVNQTITIIKLRTSHIRLVYDF